MATNQGNQRSSSDRGFAGMDDRQQREIASKGGKASASEQRRDDQGQFAGSSGSSRTGSKGGGRSGSQSSKRGNSGQARDSQGQFTSSRQSSNNR